MTKKLSRFILFTILMGALIPIGVSADENEPKTTTDATVIFIEPEDTVPPVDPSTPSMPRDLANEDPSIPISVHNAPTMNKGTLTLDTIPNFPFGSIPLGSGVNTYQTSYNTPYVQVSDRRGTGSGWELHVSASELVSSTSGTTALPYTLNIYSGDILVGLNGTSAAPTSGPTTNGYYQITHGEEALKIKSASSNAGMGTWIKKFYGTDDTSITINTSQAKLASYKATLTWTLSNTPIGD